VLLGCRDALVLGSVVTNDAGGVFSAAAQRRARIVPSGAIMRAGQVRSLSISPRIDFHAISALPAISNGEDSIIGQCAISYRKTRVT